MALWAAGPILLALILRVYGIGRLPGINADEAWYGVAALDLLQSGRFEWVTPNGNPLGPLQFGELALLHLFFEPSASLLRIPSLLSSVAAVVLAYIVAKRLGGTATAWLAALIAATLPINIAYARLGWDPSHSGALVLLATALLLGRRHLGSAAVFAGALVVHPTNLFAAPFLLMVRAGQAFEQDGADRGKAIRSYAIMLLAAVAAYYAIRAGSALANPAIVRPNLTDPAQYAAFVRRFGDLLSGETVYLYLAGKGMGAAATPLAWLIVALLGFLLVRSVRIRRFDVRQGVIVGWLASVGSFFVLAGPIALLPHFERYAFVLVAPTVLALAAMLSPYAGRRWFQALAAGTGVAALTAFLLFVVVPLNNGTDEAHPAFRTGPVEPKAAAAERLKRLAMNGPIDVVAEDFWLHLPTAYLAHGHPVRLRLQDQQSAPATRGAATTYWLVWSGGETERRIRAAGRHRLLWTSEGRRGRQVRLWQPG